MRHATTQEMLIARWTEVIGDPSLRDLPYKIELNQEGKIEMSPANNWHALAQGHLAWALKNALPEGAVLTECSILTGIGVRVPDVALASKAFLEVQRHSTPFMQAPEICVEIVSPSNTKREIDEKVRAYLAAGAKEVRVASEAGELRFFGAEGALEASAFGIRTTLPSRNDG